MSSHVDLELPQVGDVLAGQGLWFLSVALQHYTVGKRFCCRDVLNEIIPVGALK